MLTYYSCLERPFAHGAGHVSAVELWRSIHRDQRMEIHPSVDLVLMGPDLICRDLTGHAADHSIHTMAPTAITNTRRIIHVGGVMPGDRRQGVREPPSVHVLPGRFVSHSQPREILSRWNCQRISMLGRG